MTGDKSGTARKLAGYRLARFAERPAIERLAARRAKWVQSPESLLTKLQLAALTLERLVGGMSRAEYRRSIETLSRLSDLPPADFRLIARCSLEFCRCSLVQSGQLGIDALAEED